MPSAAQVFEPISSARNACGAGLVMPSPRSRRRAPSPRRPTSARLSARRRGHGRECVCHRQVPLATSAGRAPPVWRWCRSALSSAWLVVTRGAPVAAEVAARLLGTEADALLPPPLLLLNLTLRLLDLHREPAIGRPVAPPQGE